MFNKCIGLVLKFFSGLLILSLSQLTYANGNRVGNGGNVVDCVAKKSSERYQVLDLFESSRALSEFKDKNENEITESIFTDLARVAPTLSKQYLQRFKSFIGEIEVKEDIEIVSSEDSLHAALPKNCKLTQVALRKLQAAENEKRFLISKNIWQEMNAQNRSALYVHEILYEHTFKLGETDSQKARKLTAFLFSKDFAKSNAKEFWKYIKSLELPIYQY